MCARDEAVEEDPPEGQNGKIAELAADDFGMVDDTVKDPVGNLSCETVDEDEKTQACEEERRKKPGGGEFVIGVKASRGDIEEGGDGFSTEHCLRSGQEECWR